MSAVMSFAGLSVGVREISGPAHTLDEVDITRLPRPIGTLAPWRRRLMNACDLVGCAVSWIRPLARAIWDFGDQLDNREWENMACGLPDFGEIKLTTDRPGNVDVVCDLFSSLETTGFNISLSGGESILFSGYVSQLSITDELMEMSVKISGAPMITTNEEAA